VQPIHYSLILNILVLLVCGGLAYVFSAPWLVILAILTQTHALERFRGEQNEEEKDYPDQPMGFNADIK